MSWKDFYIQNVGYLEWFPKKGVHKLESGIHADLRWWDEFLLQYNGVSILWLIDAKTPDMFLATDSCLEGAGGTCENEFFHVRYPTEIKEKFTNIAHLEMIAIIVALKLWCNKLKGKVLQLSCDNEACVSIMNSGRCWDKKLLICLREAMMIVAKNDILIKLVYIQSKRNLLPDLLSRWYLAGIARRQFRSITNNKMIRRTIKPQFFNITLY